MESIECLQFIKENILMNLLTISKFCRETTKEDMKIIIMSIMIDSKDNREVITIDQLSMLQGNLTTQSRLRNWV